MVKKIIIEKQGRLKSVKIKKPMEVFEITNPRNKYRPKPDTGTQENTGFKIKK